jgi:hypothetical protein
MPLGMGTPGMGAGGFPMSALMHPMHAMQAAGIAGHASDLPMMLPAALAAMGSMPPTPTPQQMAVMGAMFHHPFAPAVGLPHHLGGGWQGAGPQGGGKAGGGAAAGMAIAPMAMAMNAIQCQNPAVTDQFTHFINTWKSWYWWQAANASHGVPGAAVPAAAGLLCMPPQ